MNKKDIVKLALVTLDEDKLGMKYIFYFPNGTNGFAGDRVVCSTVKGEKLGTIITTCYVIRGDDYSDFINEMNNKREIKPILVNLAGRPTNEPINIKERVEEECS